MNPMKHKSFLLTIMLLASTSLFAASSGPMPERTVKLYPKGQNVDEGIVENGVKVTRGPLASNSFHKEYVVSSDGSKHYTEVGDGAEMKIYLPEKCSGKMMVICPGGGYRFLSGITEGENVVRWCLDKGIAACLLIYRMPEGNPELPIRDVQNAMRYCRHHAAEWNVKEIGVIGFSAGGHLAACASTLFPDSVTRPDFAALFYAYTDLNTEGFSKSAANCTWHFTHGDQQKKDYFSMHRRVIRDTPPTFVIISNDDDKVDTVNSVEYYNALHSNGVPCELHIIGEGQHGWGFTTSALGKDKLSDSLRQSVFSAFESWLERY